MTREKAIKILSSYKNSYFGDALHGGVISVSEIIELLSAQPDLQPTCNQLATDCISREAAIHLITGYNGVMDKSVAKRLLIQMPSVQPLVLHCTACEDWHTKQGISGIAVSKLPPEQPEIIHCRDCRYSTDFYQDGCCYCKRPSEEIRYIEEGYGFYCAGAERREK